MGCIYPKLSKKRRRERKRLGLPEVKLFLKTKRANHSKIETKVEPIQELSVESEESVVKSISNATYTIQMSSSISDYGHSPVESYSNFKRDRDSSQESQEDLEYHRDDSVLRTSCSLESFESEDNIRKEMEQYSSKHQTLECVAKGRSLNNGMDKLEPVTRPEAPCGFRSETATIDVSPPPYLLPGYIDELDKDLERVISDDQPKHTSFINTDMIARPKAAKGVRTPHSIINSTIMKPATALTTLPGCLRELDEEIESVLDGNSVLLRGIGDEAYMQRPKTSRGGRKLINNSTTIKHLTFCLPGCVEELDEKIETLSPGNGTTYCGFRNQAQNPRPKAARGERTRHTNFTDFDNLNLPGTVVPSTSFQLPNGDAALSSNISPRRAQLTVRGAKSGEPKYLNNWM